MLARPARAPRQGAGPRLRAAVEDDDGREGGPLGQRAGLVDDERVDALEPFERFGVPHEHASGRPAARADHDRHRRREPERTRARDDQHRDGAHERKRQARRRSPRAPTRERDHRHGTTAGTKRPRPGRPAAGSARGCAAPRRPCGRSARAACRLPTRSARITRRRSQLIVPPMTASPGSLFTGIGSPVTIDSSMALRPSTTTPSTGTFSPGRTRQRSPDRDVGQGDIVLDPSRRRPARSSA